MFDPKCFEKCDESKEISRVAKGESSYFIKDDCEIKSIDDN